MRNQTFGFTFSLVGDMGLRMMLASTPDMPFQPPDCNPLVHSPRWVFFNPSGQFAMNIFRLF